MVLSTVAVRARIILGNLSVSTPFVLSFSVKKERNQKSTFNASLKIISSDLNNLGGSDVEIYAGTSDNMNKIFTGFILQSDPTPCWEDPKYVILNIIGADILYRLEQEKYTRLQESSKSKWALITGINRPAPKGSQFKLVNHELLKPTDGDHTTDDQKNNAFQKTDLENSASIAPSSGGRIIQLKLKTIEATA